MAISVVQTLGPFSSAKISTPFQTGAFTNPVASGNTVLVFLFASNSVSATFTVADNVAGNPNGNYTQDKSVGPSASNDYAFAFRASNLTGGSTFKLTVTPSGLTFMTVFALEVSGLAAASPLDGSGSSATGTGQPNPGAITTTNANDLLVTAFANGQTSTAGSPPSGFTSAGNQASNGSFEDGSAAYRIVAATQSGLSLLWSGYTLVGSWAALGLAYQAAAGVAYSRTLTDAPATVDAAAASVPSPFVAPLAPYFETNEVAYR